MPRDIIVPRLGVGGRNTDKPTWALRPDELADGSADAIVYEGTTRRRRGVKTYASVGSTAPSSVYRARFTIPGRTATVYIARSPTSTGRWALYDNGVLTETSFISPASEPLPRAMYGDDLYFCHADGITPTWRYGGSDPNATYSQAGAPAFVTNNATLATGSGSWAKGAHAKATPILGFAPTTVPPVSFYKVLEVNGTTYTLSGIKSSGAPTSGVNNDNRLAALYPSVVVYNAGTVSTDASNVATGVGTKWMSIARIKENHEFAILVPTTGGVYHHGFLTTSGIAATDTTLITYVPVVSNVSYQITRAPSFRDVCVHNERLYGVGVNEFPSRVYVSPAGWDPAFPPGAVLPFDPNTEMTSTNLADFLLDFIDVPSPLDSDPIVAILATDSPRLVLKKNAVYGIYGDPPSLTARLIHAGDGCIDILSAISVAEGAFWAGQDGIYRYRYGKFEDLTANWMRNEWHALTNAGIEYCACGVDSRHLVVSIKTADAAHQTRTYLYDLELERWLPEITNIHPRHMFTANISGEIQSLLCVDDAYPGKILNISPALNNSGPARDEVGTGPNFKLVTGDGWTQANGIEGEARALDIALHNTFRDTTAIGTSSMEVKFVTGGSFYGEREGQGFKYNTTLYDTSYYGPDGGKDLGDIASTPGDQVIRSQFDINRTGRRMHIELRETTTSSTLDTIEVGEAVLTVRDLRSGS